MNQYSSGTITIDGKAIATAAKIEIGERSKGLTFGDAAQLRDLPHTFNFTATIDGPDAFAAFHALRPVEPATVDMRGVPWGILGTIDVRGWVKGSTIKCVPGGTEATLDVVPDERALRRAVSMAVEQAVVKGLRSDGKRVAAVARREGRTRAVRKMARVVARRLGGAYRGERKRRKAMRRLLRAAGITVGGAR